MSILSHFLMKICRIKATKRRFDKKISQDFQVFFSLLRQYICLIINDLNYMCEFLCYDEVRKKIKFILVISKKIVSLQTENVK